MSAEKPDIRRITELAHLRLEDEELETAEAQLDRMIEYISVLREVDTTGVQPLRHPLDAVNRPREDIPGEPLPRETVIRLAPDSADGFIRLPRSLPDDGGRQ